MRPYYVRVTLPGGTVYTATKGEHAGKHEDELPNVVLVDPFSYTWAYEGEQLPAQLEPATATFTLWSRSAALIPQLQRGQLVGVALRLSSNSGPVLAAVSGMRITEARLQLVPGSRWPARLTVTASDLLVDLPSLTPTQVGITRRRSWDRLAQIGQGMARSIGVPTTSSAPPLTTRMMSKWAGSARDMLAAWCNSQGAEPAPRGGVVTPWPAASYPAGWKYPDVFQLAAIPDPASAVRYMIAPGTRLGTSSATPAPAKLPLRLIWNTVTLQLELSPAPSTEADRTAAVDALCVEVPGVMRSAREHAPNLLRVSGAADWQNGATYVERDMATEYAVATDVATTGPRAREVPTLRVLGHYDGAATDDPPTTVDAAAVADVATPFIPDAVALASSWSWDSFTIRTRDMINGDANSLLPKLAPHYPGEAGDGLVVRHLTIYGMADNVRLSATARNPDGYVVGGRFLVSGGELVVELNLTPGAPVYSGAVSRITVGDVQAAAYADSPAGSIDRRIRVLDLAQTDA